ncbi:hypothetical protein HAX54_044089 [Datura stramonium]|uniref:Uncharacterized protein n=1 Tax=Datura stramonium TaxID=4076 RepID=A0ABS8W485_DATST|nr:hypothetical protein [Datura stramonium]
METLMIQLRSKPRVSEWSIIRLRGSWFPIVVTIWSALSQNRTNRHSKLVTTRARSNVQEDAADTVTPPQSEEGDEEAEYNDDNPPANKDVYYEKGNPSHSIQEEPMIHINILSEVPDLKRFFKGYNMYWMAKTPRKYSMEMVCEFYTNYFNTLENKAPSKNETKKEPMLDSVKVRAIPVDISKLTITRFLVGNGYTVLTQTTKYDNRMEAMKGIKKFNTEDKVMYFKWMEYIIAEDKEGTELVMGRKSIY